MALCTDSTVPLSERFPVFRQRAGKFRTSRQRNQAIKSEQLQAAHSRLSNEVSRPKLVITDSEVPRPRRPRFYIELTRIRSQSRGASSESPAGKQTARSVSQLTRRTEVSEAIKVPSPRPSGPLLKKCKENSVLPVWVTDRRDFNEAYERLKEKCYADVAATCRKSAMFRTDEEKNGLRKWVLTVEELKVIQRPVMEEVMNRMHTVDFPEKTNGSVHTVPLGHTLYALLKGAVQLFPPDTSPIRLDSPCVLGADILTSTESCPACVTETTCVFIRLTKFDYEQSVLFATKQEQVITMQLLTTAPFFTSLTEVKLRRISALLSEVKYTAGDTIYTHGSEANEMYIVRDGEVSLQFPVSVTQNNRWPVGMKCWEIDQIRLKYNLHMRKCKRGDSFGVTELRSDEPRLMTAVVSQTCVLYRLSRDDFKKIFTWKEQESLETTELVRIPNKQKLAETVLEQLKADRSKKDTIFSVIQVDTRQLEARESFQSRKAKKLRAWMEDLTARTARDSHRSRARVTGLRHRRVVVGPLGMEDSSSEESNS